MAEQFYVYYESNPVREKKRVTDILNLQEWYGVQIKQAFTSDDFLTFIKEKNCKWGWFNFYGWVKVLKQRQWRFDKPVILLSCFVNQPQWEQLLEQLNECSAIERDHNGKWLIELSNFLDSNEVIS